ncbi:hypothetical protein KSP40_PGU000133 [Platanthera guangdongensis]|uniref:Uncharacterized protein n=1 Tax=Platanthera guangdongensis TaxID=2320717 RepID=A0ABR2MDZ3_9ASPA
MVYIKAIPSLLISHGECRIPQNVHVDDSEKNLLELHFDYEEHSSDDAFVPSSINGESARTIGSAMKREFASRVQISKSSEVLCRKEVSYARENMKHDQIVFKAERSTDAKIRLDGRRIPFHSYGRGRVWVDPPDHHDKWILLSGWHCLINCLLFEITMRTRGYGGRLLSNKNRDDTFLRLLMEDMNYQSCTNSDSHCDTDEEHETSDDVNCHDCSPPDIETPLDVEKHEPKNSNNKDEIERDEEGREILIISGKCTTQGDWALDSAQFAVFQRTIFQRSGRWTAPSWMKISELGTRHRPVRCFSNENQGMDSKYLLSSLGNQDGFDFLEYVAYSLAQLKGTRRWTAPSWLFYNELGAGQHPVQQTGSSTAPGELYLELCLQSLFGYSPLSFTFSFKELGPDFFLQFENDKYKDRLKDL